MPNSLRPVTTPRPLGDLADRVGAPMANEADRAVMITGVTLDSREVRPGDLFAALPGEHAHGSQFCAQAREQGAVAILTDRTGLAAASGLPAIVVDDPRGVLGALAADIYGHPGEDLALIGVTGTNGKTTTAFLLEAGLRAAGHVPAVIGTTGIRIGDEILPSARTTPEA
ncbi:MAG: Mur ligase domain-containing protein, partial [Candidatus Nanopelagicales bacterium]